MPFWNPRLYRVLTRQFKSASHDDVLDAICYSSLVAAEKQLIAKESIANMDAFSMCVAKRTLGHYEKRKRRLVFMQAMADELSKPFDDVVGAVIDTVTHVESIIDANLIVEAMPPKYAEVLRLHYVEGLTFEEASKTLGITPECMRKRHERAIKLARKLFRSGEGEPED